jgi:magnesium transporter
MRAYLFDGTTTRESDRVEEFASAVDGPGYVWLDVEDPTDVTVMRPVPLGAPALQWLGMFGQQPLFHFQSGSLRIVAFALVDGNPVEVHLLGRDHALVTVHHDAHALFDDVRQRAAANTDTPMKMTAVVLLLEDLVDSFRPRIIELKRGLYDLGTAILASPSREQMRRLAQLRHSLNELRGTLVPYAEAVCDFVDRIALIPDVSDEDRNLLQGHAAHVSAMQQQVEAMLDSASHNMETYVSMVTTRQGQVINWLTLVSIVFLPLTFLTGFFGMNFDWMVEHISNASQFWVLGVGLQVVVVLFVLFLARKLIPVLRGDVDTPGSPILPEDGVDANEGARGAPGQ